MTVKSREETRANREGTSKAGKGPLKHHEEKRREAQRASRALSKHRSVVRKRSRSRGKQGKIEAAGGRRGHQAGENRKGKGRTGGEPARLGKDH